MISFANSADFDSAIRRFDPSRPSQRNALNFLAKQQWLRTSPGELFEMRDMAVLQLFFSEFMSEADLVALANSQVRLARERLLTYAQIEQKYMPRMGRNRRMASLSLGVRMAKAR